MSIQVEVYPSSSEYIEVPLSLASPLVEGNYDRFLSCFRPAPHLVLLTAVGEPIGNGPHSDVVVVKRSKPTIVCAEVEHITTLWEFEKQGKEMVRTQTFVYVS